MKIVVFPSLQEIGSVIFFLNCCAFPFSDAKSYGLKNTRGHRVNFLVISDISEKSGLESFWNVSMVTADDKITAVLGKV